MAIRDEGLDRVLRQARSLSDQLWALATEHQSRWTGSHCEPDNSDVARTALDRHTLQTLFRTLQPRELIEVLRQQGAGEAADKLDHQWKNTAALFDPSASSDTIDGRIVDAIEASEAVSIALSDLEDRDWTRADYMNQIRGIDNAGLLDYVDNSTLETLSDEEFQRLYERLDEFSFQRARAWQGDYAKRATERQKAQRRIRQLIWLMYRAGYSAASTAQTMHESMDSVHEHLMWAMTDAGLDDETIISNLGVTAEGLDRVVWTRRTNKHDGGDGDLDMQDDDEPVEVDPIDEMYQVGHVFYNLRDLPDALVWYEKAAIAGHVEAMSMLGALLAADCNPPDLLAAHDWDEKAANAGDVLAMYNLGVLYATLMEPPDLAAARSWYEKAADRGHKGAMFNLAIISQQVDPPDLLAARAWYEKAAEAGSHDAMLGLGCLLADKWDPPDLAGAQAWFERAAEDLDDNAMFNLGWLFSNQMDPPDLPSAQDWYKQAAGLGNTNAMYELGMLLANTDPPERASARSWLEKASELGHPDAAAALARLET